MNVLYIKKLYSPIGGSEALTYQLATRLAARGHRVRVISLWPGCERNGYPPPSTLAFADRSHRLYLHAGVELYQLRPRWGRLGQALDLLAPFNLLNYELARGLAEGYDVIHSVCREYGQAARRLAGEFGAKLVLTPLVHPGQAWGGAGRQDVALYRQADAVVALTEAERAWYISRGVDPARVRAIGPGPTFEAPGDGEGFRRRYGLRGPLVLFVGRKEPYKGVRALAEAAPIVWQRHPETTFVFVGERSALYTVWDPFRGRGDRRLLDLPMLDEEEKAAAFAACDIFCLPSRHETFGLVYAEAWLCGKPVIACGIPPLREVVADKVDGLLVRQRPADVAAAIVKLLDDPALARRMGETGRAKVAARYNWERTVEETERLYQELAGERVVSGVPSGLLP